MMKRDWRGKISGRTGIYVGAILFVGLVSAVSFAQVLKDKPVKPASKDHPLKQLWSGLHYSGTDIRKIQKDPFKNPANAWSEHGARLWAMADGEAKKSCSSCHNRAEVSMKAVGSRYPRYYEARQTLINLEERVNLCRRKFMKASLYPKGSDELLALTIFVKKQSFGATLNVKIDGPAKPFFDKGKKLYYKRRGQLNLACASCHEKNAGKKLRGVTLSQGHSNGFPAYLIKREKPVSLSERINSCNQLIRATPLFADEIKSLELYLAWRGKGLPIETPAVRR